MKLFCVTTVSLLIWTLTTSFAQADGQVPMWQGGQAQSTQNGGGEQMNPKWVMYATNQLRSLMNGSAANIASSIQGITHPSGNSAQLGGYNVLNLGDHMMVQITVYWRGGMLGNSYQTSVNWELTPESHTSAQVVGDTAMVAIAEPNKAQLDDYFRQSVYPVFYSNMNSIGNLWR